MIENVKLTLDSSTKIVKASMLAAKENPNTSQS
jgi:hypothetical protein